MTENAGKRVLEPSARGPMEGRFQDWRGTGLDDQIDAARVEARRALGAAVDAGPHAADAWATAELAVQRAAALAFERLGVRGTDLSGLEPRRKRLAIQLLTAPDTRARYVFVEDLLNGLKR